MTFEESTEKAKAKLFDKKYTSQYYTFYLFTKKDIFRYKLSFYYDELTTNIDWFIDFFKFDKNLKRYFKFKSLDKYSIKNYDFFKKLLLSADNYLDQELLPKDFDIATPKYDVQFLKEGIIAPKLNIFEIGDTFDF